MTHLTNGGRIELGQRIAGRSNAETTGLSDRRNDDISEWEAENYKRRDYSRKLIYLSRTRDVNAAKAFLRQAAGTSTLAGPFDGPAILVHSVPPEC